MAHALSTILSAFAPATAIRGVARAVLTVVTKAQARRRDRLALAQLDAHLLRDIGLSQDEARSEAAKPFWRV